MAERSVHTLERGILSFSFPPLNSSSECGDDLHLPTPPYHTSALAGILYFVEIDGLTQSFDCGFM